MSQHTFPVERRVLSSWKEIAAFLRVTVRTAQRWERQLDLPVHRLETGKNARVLAYTDELTLWVESRDSGRHSEVGSPGDRAMSRIWSRSPWLRIVFWMAVAATIFAGSLLTYSLWPGPASPESWKIEGDRFKALDAEGRVCWEKTLAGLRSDAYTPEGRLLLRGSVAGEYDGILHQDIDRDGIAEWLVNCSPRTLDEDRGRLVCLEADGQLRWEFYYGAPHTWRGRSLSSSFAGFLIRVASVRGRHYVLTVANHAFWFPAQVALLDPGTGRLIEEYWHPGGLFLCKIHDLDRDGEPEVLLAGVNNPGEGLGHAALVVLSLPFSKAGYRLAEKGSEFWNSTSVRELAYVLFPRPHTYDAVGQIPVPDALAVVEGERLLVKLTRAHEGSLFYYLDSSLKLADCRISEGVKAAHKQLSAGGQLDHPWTEAEARSLCQVRAFPTAPNGNSPEVARLWDFRSTR